jgi:hypothetical protein
VQAVGACGVVYLAKLSADGTTSPVSVPGVESDSVVVIGVNGDNLHLQARASCGHCAETIHRPPLGANCRLTQLDGDRAASEIASPAIGLAEFE